MGFAETSVSIDHLGIVSAMCEELHLVDIIDEHVGTHPYQIVSPGQAVLAVIYNMLAIFQRPLYLTPHFMHKRPIDRLIAPGLEAKHFNDDLMGRTLDRLFNAGLEELFLKIAKSSFSQFSEFLGPYLHGDTTKIEVYGLYNKNDAHDGVIQLVKGFNRKKRGDFRQFIISLITCNRLPAFITTISGDVSDKKHFRELIKNYGTQIKEMFEDEKTLVFDSAFYVAETLKMIEDDFPWITRVPETVGDAKELIATLDKKKFQKFQKFQKSEPSEQSDAVPSVARLSTYRYYETESNYADIKQHWLVVFSEQAYKKEKHQLEVKIAKKSEELQEKVSKLSNKIFDSKEAAKEEVKKMASQWKYHEVKEDTIEFVVKHKKASATRGRPKKNEKMIEVYSVNFAIKVDEKAVKEEMEKKGRFIVASNRLASTDNTSSWQKLSPAELLLAYKSQSKVERGFRFIKDPMFFVDAVFLEKKQRIMAMSMLLGISLLIYSLCELQLRRSMLLADYEFADGYRKASKKPTIRRVFINFEGIHIKYTHIEDKLFDETVLNLSELQVQVLQLMGNRYFDKYQHGKQGLQQLLAKLSKENFEK